MSSSRDPLASYIYHLTALTKVIRVKSNEGADDPTGKLEAIITQRSVRCRDSLISTVVGIELNNMLYDIGVRW